MASVTIDAGHGGYDSGASYNGRYEKNDNLAIALAVGELLEQNGIEVGYTRVTDVYDSPNTKAQIANQQGSDVFVSIHRNSSPNPNTYSGVETLVYDESGIKADMANAINEELAEVGFNNLGLNVRRDLAVLRRTQMPALLVEVGFINTDADNQLLDNSFDEVAQAIANGIYKTLTGTELSSGGGAEGETTNGMTSGNMGSMPGGTMRNMTGGTTGNIPGETMVGIPERTTGNMTGGTMIGMPEGTTGNITGGNMGSIPGGTMGNMTGGTTGSMPDGSMEGVTGGTNWGISGGVMGGVTGGMTGVSPGGTVGNVMTGIPSGSIPMPGIGNEVSGNQMVNSPDQGWTGGNQGGRNAYRVQVGLYREYRNALNIAYELEVLGFPVEMKASGDLYAVQVGPFTSRQEAVDAENQLQMLGYETLVVE